MSMIAPSGPVYQAGTLSGNPLAMAAGLATLRLLSKTPAVYAELEEKSSQLEKGIEEIIRQRNLSLTQNRVGSMFTLFFTSAPVTDYASAKTSDTKLFGRYFNGMLERGIYLAPSQFEAAFVSAAHSREDIERTVTAAGESLAAAFGSR